MDYKEKYEMGLEGIQEILGSGEDSIKMSRLKLRLQGIFPELKESEDEKTMKEILNYIIKGSESIYDVQQYGKEKFEKWIAWLEKQGEQKPTIEMITPEESLGIDSETYNKIVDECIYGEQKPIDKVEPKFKDGDCIKPIDSCLGSQRTICEVCDGWYVTNQGTLDFEYENNWELVEQKPAWSEEDEKMLNKAITLLNEFGGDRDAGAYTLQEMACRNCADWLKSLRPQNTWKPSDEQMLAINTAINVLGKGTINGKYLIELQEQLKKLMEEDV